MKLKTLIILLLLSTSSYAVDLEYTITPLGTLEGGVSSEANDININGQIVGTSKLENGSTRAFLSEITENGRVTIDIGTLPTPSVTFNKITMPRAINDAGQIVGQYGGGFSSARAFLSEDLGEGRFMLDLGTLGGEGSTSATDINNNGQITGESKTLSGLQRAFLTSDTSNGRVMIDLGTYETDESAASSINNLGQVVAFGWSGPRHRPSTRHDFLSIKTGNDRVNVQPFEVGTTISQINNLGQILVKKLGLPYLATETENGQELLQLNGFLRFFSARTFIRGMNDSTEVVGYNIDDGAFLYSNDNTYLLMDLITNNTGDWSSLDVATAINNLGQIVGYGTYNNQKTAFLLVPVTPVVSTTCELGSDPQIINAGEGVPLWWWTQGGNNLPILNNGIGQVDEYEGYEWVYPTETTTYKMSVNGRGGQATCETTIVVEGVIDPVPPLCALGADPQTIRAGDDVPLWWWFQDSVITANIDNQIGSVGDFQGYKWVQPTETTTYTMTVENGGGTTGTCETTIEVEGETDPTLPICTIGTYHQVLGPNERTTVWWWTPDEFDRIDILPVLGRVENSQGTFPELRFSETTTIRMTVQARGRSGFCETTVVVE
ncbi:MAG: hypothetical protein V3U75_04900 [Methylococcaceae bacterium]